LTINALFRRLKSFLNGGPIKEQSRYKVCAKSKVAPGTGAHQQFINPAKEHHILACTVE